MTETPSFDARTDTRWRRFRRAFWFGFLLFFVPFTPVPFLVYYSDGLGVEGVVRAVAIIVALSCVMGCCTGLDSAFSMPKARDSEDDA